AQALRNLVVRILRGAGYTVAATATGEEALAYLERNPVDLVITDVVMPGMRGDELARRVQERHPTVRVLFVSGYTADAILDRGMRDGPVPVVAKPFSAAELRARVRLALDAAPR